VETEVTDTGAWTAERHVTELYQAHALSLARLALVMLGDRAAAEDVVQDAFLGLYRRWDRLADPAAAQSYLRTSVLNSCRTTLRRRSRRGILADGTAGARADGALVDILLLSRCGGLASPFGRGSRTGNR
jgi:DNA-directed RNA polymerase specialized sigma24 family protein